MSANTLFTTFSISTSTLHNLYVFSSLSAIMFCQPAHCASVKLELQELKLSSLFAHPFPSASHGEEQSGPPLNRHVDPCSSEDNPSFKFKLHPHSAACLGCHLILEISFLFLDKPDYLPGPQPLRK